MQKGRRNRCLSADSNEQPASAKVAFAQEVSHCFPFNPCFSIVCLVNATGHNCEIDGVWKTDNSFPQECKTLSNVTRNKVRNQNRKVTIKSGPCETLTKLEKRIR